ncbi:uncharacterized protein LOC126899170 [Daktulosphaira vitifoliae]|uniref:uncharacterized protein LOC126899170 n=1 Tax=Daktulosphaira vitifoliae TaxID=58002 RepID=UPI0021A9F62C|nr:uncharacterized protein LOC126899170 [Daktulosphaira vitifoliae]
MLNKTTGKSPFQALYGYSPMLQDGFLDKLVTVTTLTEDPVDSQTRIRENIAEAQQKWKQRYDKRKVEAKFQVGEIVFLRCPPVPLVHQQKYRGPLVVTKVCDGDTYKIASVRPTHRRLYATTAHVSLLKQFNSQAQVDDSTEKEGGSESEEPEPTVEVGRPRRNVAIPKRYKGFVM